jgi:hypothetical protein
MGELNVQEFGLVIAGDDQTLLAGIKDDAEKMRGTTLQELMEQMGSILSPQDREIMQGEMGPFLVDTLRAAVAEEVFGGFDDDMAFLHPWGFDPADIRVPTQVWQGANDLMVPFGHGEWLAGHIPGGGGASGAAAGASDRDRAPDLRGARVAAGALLKRRTTAGSGTAPTGLGN